MFHKPANLAKVICFHFFCLLPFLCWKFNKMISRFSTFVLTSRPVRSLVDFFQRFVSFFEESFLAQVILFLRLLYRIFVALALSVFLYFSFLHQYLPETNHTFPVNMVPPTLNTFCSCRISINSLRI